MCSGKGESNIQKQVLRLPHLALILKKKVKIMARHLIEGTGIEDAEAVVACFSVLIIFCI